MQRQFWQRALALLALAFLFSMAEQALPATLAIPGGDVALRAVLTAAWVIVAVILLRSMRRIGLQGLSSQPADRRTVLNLGMQLLLAAMVAVAALVIADMWRFNFSGLALGGAFTGVVVGLAAQSTLGNAIAGAMILGLRPFRVGEWASLHVMGWDCTGRVEEINFFYTVLRDGGVRRVVPNSLVAASPANVTERQVQPAQTISLPYRIAPERAREILQPYRSAEVVDLRVDNYALRVEWLGERSAERLAALASLVGQQN